jgi:hypothetical protein
MKLKFSSRRVLAPTLVALALLVACSGNETDNPVTPTNEVSSSSEEIIIDISSSSEVEPISSSSSSEVISSNSASSSSLEEKGEETSSSSAQGIVHGPSVEWGGEIYESVVIGTQTWINRNMNIDPNDIEGWTGAKNSWCYNDNPANCEIYGRLYDWATMMKQPESSNGASTESENVQGICPPSWHIPDDEEWEELSTSPKNLEGFVPLLGGYRNIAGDFEDIEIKGRWWTATNNGRSASCPWFGTDGPAKPETVQTNCYGRKTMGRSVRCVKD